MNDLLQLKGNFNQKRRKPGGGSPQLPNGTSIKVSHLEELFDDLNELFRFWSSERIIDGALVSVYYKRVIPKSRRIVGFLSTGSLKSNSSIVGARFSDDKGKKKHIITHYISLKTLELTLNRLKETIRILKDVFNGEIKSEDIKFENFNKRKINFNKDYKISKISFLQFVVDSYFIEKFDVIQESSEFSNNSIITIFDTKSDTKNLMQKIGIKIMPNKIIDKTTLLLTPDELSLLKSKAPYLISMATSDISKLSKDDFIDNVKHKVVSIPSPSDEPIIGVIDTMFDENVYFSDWVKFKNMLSDNIPLEPSDYRHGTAVSSVIVDGPQINPDLDDGCGRFRVRHFGVAINKQFSSFSIVRAIKEIVTANKDIKVWNLSLGSNEEVNKNFISPEAAILDNIQYENDVIFIISGTNKEIDDDKDKVIGSPADSINSLVVNAVDINNRPPSYARRGIVLSFFNKPDVCCFGGSSEKHMRVIEPNGESLVSGTSFAAPWITRKVAYLMHVMGLSREVAKALIIDSANRWKSSYDVSQSSLLGHGVVPLRIEDVIKSNDDEIKFILSGISQEYDTYTYNIPVPIFKKEHPFIAKATLCYFPKCSRNQGVDYTNTELDIYFGRIDKRGKIKSINKNKQSIDDEVSYLKETNARKLFRKWDNSKHIKELFKSGVRARKAYDNGMWGVSIKTKNRLESKDGKDIRFGVVITLKEINGVNRIDDFIQQCYLRGWLVNRINVENRIDIYNRANEEIKFE